MCTTDNENVSLSPMILLFSIYGNSNVSFFVSEFTNRVNEGLRVEVGNSKKFRLSVVISVLLLFAAIGGVLVCHLLVRYMLYQPALNNSLLLSETEFLEELFDLAENGDLYTMRRLSTNNGFRSLSTSIDPEQSHPDSPETCLLYTSPSPRDRG